MNTNRRNFIKSVCYLLSGALASISGFVSAALGSATYPTRASTGIDPNSEWAKQKPLTLERLIETRDELISIEIKTIPEFNWKSLGCKDCYRECRHWDECKAILEKRVKAHRIKGEWLSFDAGDISSESQSEIEHLLKLGYSEIDGYWGIRDMRL